MKKSPKIIAILATPFLLFAPLAVAQQPASESPPSSMEMQSPGQTQATPSPDRTEQMQNMDKMATMYYKIAAGVTIISLLTIALVLLVILEIQWIIYWAGLLKERKRRSTG